jgi:hypothetical protein
MKLSSTLCIAAAMTATLFTASTARADQTAASTVSQIKVLEASDVRYKLFHGAVWLRVDKATQNYRWGGKHCGGGRLSDSTLKLLYDAFREKDSVSIDYTPRKYKKDVFRCITGLTVTR